MGRVKNEICRSFGIKQTVWYADFAWKNDTGIGWKDTGKSERIAE